MKKVLLSFLLVLIFLAFGAPSSVWANSQFERLSAGTTIESDYIRAAQSIQIDGVIKGDAFLMGGIVTINGKIDGDLFVIGGKVNVNGEVGNNVRIIAGDVIINSPIGRNIALICGNCAVSRQSSIEGSVLVGGLNMDLYAQKVGRGLRYFGSRLYLNSPVASETFVVANREFLLGPQASISGELKYTGNQEVVIESGATVAGSIVYQKTNQGENYPRFFGAQNIFGWFQKIRPLVDFLGFFAALMVGFLLLGLFPRAFEKVSSAIENKPYASLGWGVIIVLMVPTMALLFAVTIVGIPVSFVLLIIAYVLWTLAQYFVAFFLGRKILLTKFGERRGWALFLGLFILYLLGLLPVIGVLVKLILVLFAIGAVVPAYKQPALVEQTPLPFESKPSISPSIGEVKHSRGRPRKEN